MRFRMSIHDNVRNDADQNKKRDSGGDDQGGSLSHISNAPLHKGGIAWFTTTEIFSQGEYAVMYSTTGQSNTP